MKGQHKTTFLTALITADLACFVLGGLNYGDQWSVAGVVGLFLFLLLLEVL
jgi:hypothetical protein